MPPKTSSVTAAILQDFFDAADHHMITIGLMKTQFCFRRATTTQKKDIKDLERKISASLNKVRQHKRHKMTGPQIKALKRTLSVDVRTLRNMIVDTCYLKNKKLKVKDLVWKQKAKSLYEVQAPDQKPVKLEQGQILADGMEIADKPDIKTYELKETAKCTSMYCRVVDIFKRGNKTVMEKVILPIVNRTWKITKDTASGAKNMGSKAIQTMMNNWGYIIFIFIIALQYYPQFLEMVNPELRRIVTELLKNIAQAMVMLIAVKNGAQAVQWLNSMVTQKASLFDGAVNVDGIKFDNVKADHKSNINHESNIRVDSADIKQGIIIFSVILFATSILPYVLDAEKRKGLPKLPSFPKVTFDSTKKTLNKYKYPIIFVLLIGAGVGVFKFGLDKQFVDYINTLRESPIVREGFQKFLDLLKKLRNMFPQNAAVSKNATGSSAPSRPPVKLLLTNGDDLAAGDNDEFFDANSADSSDAWIADDDVNYFSEF